MYTSMQECQKSTSLNGLFVHNYRVAALSTLDLTVLRLWNSKVTRFSDRSVNISNNDIAIFKRMVCSFLFLKRVVCSFLLFHLNISIQNLLRNVNSSTYSNF